MRRLSGLRADSSLRWGDPRPGGRTRAVTVALTADGQMTEKAEEEAWEEVVGSEKEEVVVRDGETGTTHVPAQRGTKKA